jgi:hypothetical protein
MWDCQIAARALENRPLHEFKELTVLLPGPTALVYVVAPQEQRMSLEGGGAAKKARYLVFRRSSLFATLVSSTIIPRVMRLFMAIGSASCAIKHASSCAFMGVCNKTCNGSIEAGNVTNVTRTHTRSTTEATCAHHHRIAARPHTGKNQCFVLRSCPNLPSSQ